MRGSACRYCRQGRVIKKPHYVKYLIMCNSASSFVMMQGPQGSLAENKRKRERTKRENWNNFFPEHSESDNIVIHELVNRFKFNLEPCWFSNTYLTKIKTYGLINVQFQCGLVKWDLLIGMSVLCSAVLAPACLPRCTYKSWQGCQYVNANGLRSTSPAVLGRSPAITRETRETTSVCTSGNSLFFIYPATASIRYVTFKGSEGHITLY